MLVKYEQINLNCRLQIGGHLVSASVCWRDSVQSIRERLHGLHMRRECRKRFSRHRLHRKPLVSAPGKHHGMCVTHVPWCISGSLIRGGGDNVLAFPAHAQPAILRIWQEAHGTKQGALLTSWPLSPLNHYASKMIKDYTHCKQNS